MNNQNNLNNQTGNQPNNQQPINFGNSLSGNNDFNQNQQMQTNVGRQIIPEINNQYQSNLNIVDNQQNIGVNNQPIPEINNNINNIQSQNVNIMPEVKIPSENNVSTQIPNNQVNINIQPNNQFINQNQQIPTPVNAQNVEKKKSKKTKSDIKPDTLNKETIETL